MLPFCSEGVIKCPNCGRVHGGIIFNGLARFCDLCPLAKYNECKIARGEYSELPVLWIPCCTKESRPDGPSGDPGT